METTTWIFTNFQMLLFTETDLHGCLDGYEVNLIMDSDAMRDYVTYVYIYNGLVSIWICMWN